MSISLEAVRAASPLRNVVFSVEETKAQIRERIFSILRSQAGDRLVTIDGKEAVSSGDANDMIDTMTQDKTDLYSWEKGSRIVQNMRVYVDIRKWAEDLCNKGFRVQNTEAAGKKMDILVEP